MTRYNVSVKPFFILLFSTAVFAQTATPSLQFRGEPQGSKHAAIVAAPVEGAAAGKVTLILDVTPAKPGIHVYAPGSKDYIPISVSWSRRPLVSSRAS